MDMGALLADQLDRLLRGLDGSARMQAEEQGAGALGLASELADLGLGAALVSEARGGAGLGWRDLAPVFLTLGYHAAPVPLGETIVAHWAMDLLSQPDGDEVPGIALGRLSGGARVSGRVQVPWRSAVGRILATLDDGRLALIDASGADAAPLRTIGRDPALRLVLADAPVVAVGGSGPLGLEGAMALLRSAQIAGALSRILELSIEYGNTRVQFGRPIGKFQAVQHLIAGLAGEAACARAAVDLAFAAADRGAGWETVAVAKIRTSLAVPKSTFAAHETHGAIGVTEEHVLHYFTRRLMQWREEAGDEHYWSERLGTAALERNGAGLWPMIVGLSGG